MIDLDLLLLAFALSAFLVWLASLLPKLGAVVVTPDGTVMRLPAEEPEWKSHIMMKSGGGSAPAPDPAVGAAALEEMALGREWLGFAKEQFGEASERQVELDALTKAVTEQQIQTQDESNAWGREDRERYKTVFQPLQDEFIDTAKSYDSPEKQEAMAAEARADVAQGAKAANESNTRTMASMGINPNSGRFQGATRAQETVNGLNTAGAANAARQATRDKALALKADAINMGSGLPSSTASAYGIGLNAGNSATSNNQAANQNFTNNVGIMSNGYKGAGSSLASGAGILNQQYNSQLSAWNSSNQANASGFSGLMGAAGTFAGWAAF